MSGLQDVPQSKRRRHRPWSSAVWLVPIISALLVGWIVWDKIIEAGPTIQISFREGQGVTAKKTDLRYRGVKLGEVSKIELSGDLKHVLVSVELERTASRLATKGSQFWIVRPEISATGIRGLGTLISGAYIAAMPGKGDKETNFVGLETPPAVSAEQRGLQLYLTSPRKKAVQEGTPIFYKGVQVGAAAESVLADDARSVRTRVVIERAYRPLVRQGSKFWNVGGIDFKFSLLHGAEISAKSAGTLIQGGVAFASPDPPGAEAKDGQVYPLQDKAQDAWTKWSPAIKLGDQRPAQENEQDQ